MYIVIDVMWAKAHLTPEEALQCAQIDGYTVQHHELNRGADALATSGVAMHTEGGDS